MRNILSVFVLTIVMAASFAAQDLKPDELIAKHLDAIGKKETRAAVKTLWVQGASEFESRLPLIKGGGKALAVSDPSNLFFVMGFNSKEYPYERIGSFNGKSVLPFISAGNRSLLGVFLNEHEKVLSDGLFFGALSLRWILTDPERRGARLTSGGTKKIDGKNLYTLDYSPGSGGAAEFKVRIFFDAAFNHVRTEYKREVQRGQGTFGQANQQSNAIITLTEVYGDFKTIDGMTLPQTYRVTFGSNSNSTNNEQSWGFKVTQFVFNPESAVNPPASVVTSLKIPLPRFFKSLSGSSPPVRKMSCHPSLL